MNRQKLILLLSISILMVFAFVFTRFVLFDRFRPARVVRKFDDLQNVDAKFKILVSSFPQHSGNGKFEVLLWESYLLEKPQEISPAISSVNNIPLNSHTFDLKVRKNRNVYTCVLTEFGESKLYRFEYEIRLGDDNQFSVTPISIDIY